jgi:hypothetical protein
MKDMRYLQSEEKFLEYAFQALEDHFQNKDELIKFYDSIKTDEHKSLFLKTCSFYLFLVKRCSITNDVPGVDNHVDYISNTLKYVAIFSLIESLYCTPHHIDFFEFLLKKSNHIEFPIRSKQELQNHYKNYKAQYGARQKAVDFFARINDLHYSRLQAKTGIVKDEGKVQHLTVGELSKILYDIRSRFMHQAKLIDQLSERSVISSIGREVFLWETDIKDLMYVFEKGVLRFFEAKK